MNLLGTGVALLGTLSGAGYYLYENPDKMPDALANFVDDLTERALQPANTIPEPKTNVIGRVCFEDIKPCTPTSTAIGTMAVKNSDPKPLSEISPNLVAAVIASEDRRFWEHEGVNGTRTVKALIKDVQAGAFVQGGSTIDTQMVKNAYEAPTEKDLRSEGVLTGLATRKSLEAARKIHDMRIALALNNVPKDQRMQRKREILEKYLNIVYFGRGAYGAEAAAQAYFNTSAEALKPYQSAYLGSTLARPDKRDLVVTEGDGIKTKEELLAEEIHEGTVEYKQVLDAMVQTGALTAEARDRLKAMKITDFIIANRSRPQINIPEGNQRCTRHLMEYTIAEIHEKTGLDRQDLINSGATVETTINSKDQAALCDVIKNDANVQRPDVAGAGVAMHQSGAINAMVGNEAFDQEQLNIAAHGKREAGSVFKGIIAALAFAADETLTLETEIDISTPVTFKGDVGGKDWVVKPKHKCPNDVCKKQIGDIVAESDNVGAARLVQDYIGIPKFIETLQALGIPAKEFPSVILGTGQYNTLQIAAAMNGLILNKGVYRSPFLIKSVIIPGKPNKDPSKAEEAKVLYQHATESGKRVIEEPAARLAIMAMNKVITAANGTAYGAAIPASGSASVAGKTGTGDTNTDFYFGGSMWHRNGGQTAVIWEGNPKGKIEIKGVSSNSVAKTWAQYMVSVSDPTQGSLTS
ncbi:MAG: transglycosylase domain-containing protein [Patescibacteria group bacterium]